MTTYQKDKHFSMQQAAEECGFKSRNKLFAFLRQYNIIRGDCPAAEFVCKGYFTVIFKAIYSDGHPFKTVRVIKVSHKGIKFISNLYKLINKDSYVNAQ